MAEQPEVMVERDRLGAERETVAHEIERLRRTLLTELEFEPEEGDPELIEREKNLALLRTFEERLEEIDQAIAALDEGTYGICERCGNQIDPERLRIVPETTLCVACKSIVEKNRRLAGL